MLEAARAGKRVVRLHAGDPLVFARGGEEVDALAAAGITWEVVPGVSAVTAAPAAAGTPLTQRGLARGFTVRTGHDAGGPTQGELPAAEETVVVLMALGSAEEVLAGLAAEGRPLDTPAVAISNASRKDERVVAGTLATLAARIREAELASPATLVVGEVARRVLAAEPEAARVGGVGVAHGDDIGVTHGRQAAEVA
jgi:siroheme synthase